MNSQQRDPQYPYSLYQELAETLFEPIDETLPLGVRYHLSCDKIKYLERLRREAFVQVNTAGPYTQGDLASIQNAIAMAQESLKDLVMSTAITAVRVAGEKRKRP